MLRLSVFFLCVDIFFYDDILFPFIIYEMILFISFILEYVWSSLPSATILGEELNSISVIASLVMFLLFLNVGNHAPSTPQTMLGLCLDFGYLIDRNKTVTRRTQSIS